MQQLRQRLLCLAASSADEPSLDAALAHCGCTLTSQALTSAAWAGHTAACKRLLAVGCEVGVAAACAAAEAGHLSLCSLLWPERGRDYEFSGDVEEDIEMASWDVAHVAQAACFGGHARVLQWLENDAGLYDESERWGQEHRRQEINEDLAAAAARGGHVSLMRRLLAKLPRRNADGTWRWRLLCNVAKGCPLPVFRDLAERWRQLEPPQPAAPTAAAEAAEAAVRDGCALLLHALGSHTPDWKEKVELVLARRPDLLAAVTAAQGAPPLVDHNLFDSAAAQTDFEQRVRYLISDKGAGAAWAQAAAAAAAGAGDVAALCFLLDECGVRLSGNCICDAAAHRQHAVLECLRGRGQLPSCSWDGRTLYPSAAPVCVLAAAAVVAAAASPSRPSSQPANQARGFWSRVFKRAARQGADVAALRYLHEQLGAEVQLRPIAKSGSVEQLEWALGVVADGAGTAAAQGPAPAAQDLLLAALDAGNVAVASHLHARGLAPVLPTAGQVIGLCHKRPVEPESFVAVRWFVEQRHAAAPDGAGAGGAAVGRAGAGGAAAIGGTAGEAPVGLADAEWNQLLTEVGLDGRLLGRFSENQWKWLKAAFLASPVLPRDTTAASAAGGLGFSRTHSAVTGMMNKHKQEAALASAGAEGSAEWEWERELEREWEREWAWQQALEREQERMLKWERAQEQGPEEEWDEELERAYEMEMEPEREWMRVEGMMAARPLVAADIERRFGVAVKTEEKRMADAYDEAEAEYRQAEADYYYDN
ncbi:hypothetical protein HXX76_002955 [Chlamydomonas incerta]|uniref:Uncharacterized protein n=1 Tax=Chlamydomonas incerta TaxID=51695 RepID=A0A835TEZ8_CHLIN|nr:hypothetical protein HXX76_002955 [Chlamydomonas incerta]|eukprot:KAG2442876.1 hypothetical protein HXX76_002955 [Chlamydomonas incerta]